MKFNVHGSYDLELSGEIVIIQLLGSWNTEGVKAFFEDYKVDLNITKSYKNKFVILYLGDTNIRRGLETAISSVEKLKYKIPNL
mgnify:CR=1 FL=1